VAPVTLPNRSRGALERRGRDPVAFAPRKGHVRLALIVVAAGLLGSLLYPFASALLLASVLAGALHPWFERLALGLGRRRNAAAALLTLAVLLLVVVPLVTLLVTLGGEVVEGVSYLRETLHQGGVPALVERLPPPFRSLAGRLAAALPQRPAELEQLAGNHGGAAARAMGGMLAATGLLVVKMGVMLVAFFFLLLDGKRLVNWLVGVTPLPEPQTRRLLSDFRNVSVAVLLASLGTAAVQATVALAGYLVAGVPRPLFFAMMTFILALIPVAGATSVVLALAALMALGNHPTAALFLLAWGVLVVGLIDNLVKPWLMRGRMDVHAGLILLALLGGLAMFGPIGLIAGPLILGFFLAVVRMPESEAPVEG
jgi:predicted PurR-regulated permease PerM